MSGSESSSRDPRIDAALRHLQRAVLTYPLAARAAHGALVREGQAFATTEEGKLIRQRLLRSELVIRLRSTWDIVTCGVLADTEGGALPSVVLEAFARASLEPFFETRAARAVGAAPAGDADASPETPRDT